MTTRPLVNITRLEGGSPGWWVRFERGGIRYSRLFTDRKARSKRLALSLAVAWRNRTRARLPPPDTSRKRVKQ